MHVIVTFPRISALRSLSQFMMHYRHDTFDINAPNETETQLLLIAPFRVRCDRKWYAHLCLRGRPHIRNKSPHPFLLDQALLICKNMRHSPSGLQYTSQPRYGREAWLRYSWNADDPDLFVYRIRDILNGDSMISQAIQQTWEIISLRLARD